MAFPFVDLTSDSSVACGAEQLPLFWLFSLMSYEPKVFDLHLGETLYIFLHLVFLFLGFIPSILLLKLSQITYQLKCIC